MLENYMPEKFRNNIVRAANAMCDLQEIRLRANKPVILKSGNKNNFIAYDGSLTKSLTNAVCVSSRDINEIMMLLASNSIYAYKEDIKNGFITLKQGHRAGICGRGVVAGGSNEYIREISSINIRIAHEVKGCSNSVIKSITDSRIKNTVIISPPGCGKTTMLRDISRNISDMEKNVCIVDERSEIFPASSDDNAFDLGMCTDVLSEISKVKGMRMVLRTMNPDVIVTDEIATYEDFKTVNDIINSGVRVIASFHGDDYKDYMSRINQMGFEKSIFDLHIVLAKKNKVGTVVDVV